MSKKHLKLAPINLTPKSWYYEDERGIQVFTQIEKTDRTTIELPIIPWSKIRSSLKRKDRKL